jgi:hypothetical protein
VSLACFFPSISSKDVFLHEEITSCSAKGVPEKECFQMAVSVTEEGLAPAALSGAPAAAPYASMIFLKIYAQ